MASGHQTPASALPALPAEMPQNQAVVGLFNKVFAQFVDWLIQKFPQGNPDLVKLRNFVVAVNDVDSDNMLICMRLWLDYFGCNLYEHIMKKDPALWQATNLFGVDMNPYMQALAGDEMAYHWFWTNIQLLATGAHVIANMPQPRVIQLNAIVSNVRDLLIASMPILKQSFTHVVGKSLEEVKSTTEGASLLQTFSSILPMVISTLGGAASGMPSGMMMPPPQSNQQPSFGSLKFPAPPR